MSQEAFCVVHGFIYFLAIPSMYMLLMMYSMTNLHVVSWGTREVKQTKTEEEQAAVSSPHFPVSSGVYVLHQHLPCFGRTSVWEALQTRVSDTPLLFALIAIGGGGECVPSDRQPCFFSSANHFLQQTQQGH